MTDREEPAFRVRALVESVPATQRLKIGFLNQVIRAGSVTRQRPRIAHDVTQHGQHESLELRLGMGREPGCVMVGTASSIGSGRTDGHEARLNGNPQRVHKR